MNLFQQWAARLFKWKYAVISHRDGSHSVRRIQSIGGRTFLTSTRTGRLIALDEIEYTAL